jgi:hypothetical protein
MAKTVSIKRLKNLGFDPLVKLVDIYREVEDEVAIQKGMRDGSVMMLNPNTAKPRSYVGEHHLNLLDKQISIADKLMRYQYARVPENGDEKRAGMPTLNITLNKQGAHEEDFEMVDD